MSDGISIRLVPGPIRINGIEYWSCFNETDRVIELDVNTPESERRAAIADAVPHGFTHEPSNIAPITRSLFRTLGQFASDARPVA